jgi:SET domain-containing protein
MPRKIVARRSAIHGNGVFAVAPIAKGERVIEYKGRRRTHEEVDADEAGDVDSGHTFLFTLNDEYVIDANYEGNTARWINHSCSPNCEALLEEDDGDDRTRDRVFIEAIRDIKPGEELFYNYGITLEEKHTPELKKIWECRCGSRNCTGTMLQPKNPSKAKKGKAKKAKSAKSAKGAGSKAGTKKAGSKKTGTSKAGAKKAARR